MRYFYCLFTIYSLLIFSLTAEEKNAIYYNKTGWENLNKGDYFRAIISFKEALKQNPFYSRAMIGLGNAYLYTEAFDESLKLFNDSLKLEKNSVEAFNGIGFAMIGLGRYNDALVFFDRSLKLSEENFRARYGVAYIYYLMDKILWSKRKLETILKINPYHYESLLLMAEIKIADGRTDEAKQYILKAVDSNAELPDGYIKYGEAHLKDYYKTDNIDYLNEAINEFSKALAIHPENLNANRCMGYVSLLQRKYDEAIKYYEKALSSYPNNGVTMYNLALSFEKNNGFDQSLNYYVKALKICPSDSILQSKLEDFLVLNDYAIGHPLRVKFSDEHFETSIEKTRKNLSSDAILHLQRSLLLNPANREARENLRDYFITQNYYRYYIDEIKTLYQIFPEKKYQDLLNVAVIKRRDKLYNRTGYGEDLPPRDVPSILILNLWPYDEITIHPDAGAVIANYLTFTFAQYGRMQVIGLKERLNISGKIKEDKKDFADNLETLAEIVKSGEIEKIDFILFGTFREASNIVTINCELMNFNTGVIISNFKLSESAKENIPRLSLRAAKRIYDIIPFNGKVLKSDEHGVIVNIGLLDGVKPGELLEISKLKSPEDNKLNIKEKIVMVVEESDTLISSAKPLKSSDLQLIEINDRVYPLNKKRSKMIE